MCRNKIKLQFKKCLSMWEYTFSQNKTVKPNNYLLLLVEKQF